MPDPLYTVANSRVAYQLHWSVALFAKTAWPEKETWWDRLSQAVEQDGVRLLEYHSSGPTTGQIFVSTRPEVSPVATVRSLKGRLQYLVRDAIPQFWLRHYAITSVGAANNDVLQGNVGRQVEHHPMADPRIVERLSKAQYQDAAVDLAALRSSSHGRFTHSLHLVFENAEHLADVRQEWLETSRLMVIAACQKKGWLLSRLGLVSNHLHALLGCAVTDAPRDVALSLLNNLAYAHGMRRVFESSFYVGTFGPYDHQGIRRLVADQ
jgi:REP element-mobilizing transposase RayT